MFLNNLLADYAVDAVAPIVTYMVYGFIVAVVAIGAVVFFAERACFNKYAKCAVIAGAFFALVVGILMLALEIAKHYDLQYLEDKWVSADVIAYVFVPVLVTLVLVLIGAVALIVVNKVKPEVFKKLSYVVGAVCGVAFVISIVTMALYFTNNIVGDGYYDDAEYGKLDQIALYVSAAVLVVGAIVVAFVLDRKNTAPFDSRCISLAGITVALSFALSYIKMWEMPQGGSITLASLLPVMLFAYVYGPKKGLLVGLIYGTLQAVQDCYIIHPAQFLLDYPIAFSMVAFAGAFANVKALDKLPQVKFALGAILAGALRFTAHLLSGVFAFGAYAMDAGIENFWAYSAAYNSFVFVDLILVVVLGAMLLSSKAFVKQLGSFSAKVKA